MLNKSHCGCLLRFQINAKYDFMKGKKPMICNSCTVLVIYSFSYNGSMLILCPVVAAILDCWLTQRKWQKVDYNPLKKN